MFTGSLWLDVDIAKHDFHTAIPNINYDWTDTASTSTSTAGSMVKGAEDVEDNAAKSLLAVKEEDVPVSAQGEDSCIKQIMSVLIPTVAMMGGFSIGPEVLLVSNSCALFYCTPV